MLMGGIHRPGRYFGIKCNVPCAISKVGVRNAFVAESSKTQGFSEKLYLRVVVAYSTTLEVLQQPRGFDQIS
jgi:hypothetical protein